MSSEPIGYVECQVCDQPAALSCEFRWTDEAKKKQRATVLLCEHHVRLLGKHGNFTAAMAAAANHKRKSKE